MGVLLLFSDLILKSCLCYRDEYGIWDYMCFKIKDLSGEAGQETALINVLFGLNIWMIGFKNHHLGLIINRKCCNSLPWSKNNQRQRPVQYVGLFVPE